MPERPLYGLFGAGGFGRPVMPILQAIASERHGEAADVVFIDDAPGLKQVNGVRVISTEAFLAAPRAATFFNVALSNPHAREAFRRQSYFSDIAVGVISGLGAFGYEAAVRAAALRLARTP